MWATKKLSPLAWVGSARKTEHDAIVVLDSDGEDDPKYIPEMLSMFFDNPKSAILAKRAQRSEGFVFKTFYHIYKYLF